MTLDARCDDIALVGGKAAGLARLLRVSAERGFAVPEGFCWTADDSERLIEATGVDREAAPDSETMLARFPADLAEPLATHAREIGLAAGLAVRSSAVDEDDRASSFAGVHTTSLGVTTIDALLRAVCSGVASAWSDGARAYRRRARLQARAAMPLLIQRLVPARTAGVLFTRDPRGDDVTLIEAVWGLGESLVQGRSVPDRFRVDAGVVVTAELGNKLLEVSWNGERIVERAATRKARVWAITSEEVAHLAAVGRRLEAAFGHALDVEWAIGPRGDFALLQARPLRDA